MDPALDWGCPQALTPRAPSPAGRRLTGAQRRWRGFPESFLEAAASAKAGAGEAAGGAGPAARSCAVTIMAAVTRPVLTPRTGHRAGPRGCGRPGLAEASRTPARRRPLARSYRLRGRLPGAQEHGDGAARPPLRAAGSGVRVWGSAGSPGGPQPLGLPWRGPATPLPWQPGRRPAEPVRNLRFPLGRPCACAESTGAGRPTRRAPGVPGAERWAESREKKPAGNWGSRL